MQAAHRLPQVLLGSHRELAGYLSRGGPDFRYGLAGVHVRKGHSHTTTGFTPVDGPDRRILTSVILRLCRAPRSIEMGPRRREVGAALQWEIGCLQHRAQIIASGV